MARRTRALAAALALIGAGGLIGCEDTPVAPGQDWTIGLIAQPSIVSLSPVSGLADTELIATVLDNTGVPQSGVSVQFSNAGGLLASHSAWVETDDSGRAFDTLTVRTADPDEIEVKVISGTLSATATVTKAEACAGNQKPVARITGGTAQTFPGNGADTVDVPLDGSLSSDPDGTITSYTWLCGNGAPATTSDQPDTICTYAVGSLSRNFTATLQVSDNGTGRSGNCVQVSDAATVTITVTP